MKTVFIFLLIANQAFGQSNHILRTQLKKSDYSNFCEVYNNKKNLIRNVSFGETWGLKRQVSNSFYEETKYISIETPIKNNQSSYNLDVYKICVLSNNDKIAIYKFQEKKYKTIDSLNTEIYYQTLDSFNEINLINDFQAEFFTLFKTNPILEDLFQEKYTFGSYCTFSGDATKGQIEIDSLVKKNNKESIVSYLKDINTEKQLFGVVGVKELIKKGITISEDEKAIIQFIIRKKGEIDYCSGCNYENANIQTIMKDYEF